MLLFDCVIGYISEDGKECLVRWPPVLPGKQEQAGDVDAAMSGQGKIVLACDCSLKDLAEDCGSAANSSHETTTTGTPTQYRASVGWCTKEAHEKAGIYVLVLCYLD